MAQPSPPNDPVRQPTPQMRSARPQTTDEPRTRANSLETILHLASGFRNSQLFAYWGIPWSHQYNSPRLRLATNLVATFSKSWPVDTPKLAFVGGIPLWRDVATRLAASLSRIHLTVRLPFVLELNS